MPFSPSTIRPTTVGAPSMRVFASMRTVRREMRIRRRPSRTATSTTGMMDPRRFTRPRKAGTAPGTRVTGPTIDTSRTRSRLTAKSSPEISKAR